MRIHQTAGRCEVEASTDGFPPAVAIKVRANNGEQVTARVSTAELHDLRYCVDRVLAQLETEGKAP